MNADTAAAFLLAIPSMSGTASNEQVFGVLSKGFDYHVW